MKWPILVPLVASLILTLSCAKQQFPPGGPEDRTPPEILLTQPEHGSVGIDLQPTISITFSERMDRKRIREAVFVSPPPDGDIKIGWKKNSLRINFTDSLTPDKTYLVTIGSGATDEHNNKLEESFTLAFSTGETLDSGAIRGVIRENGQLFAGATI
ncbi:MAG: Ig-like domain-containing protein, partial [candidate division Zixibacteria bacterium]|nr:Ig-like domain-containing protein [candidate division Zixibacteria bacterium]